MGRKIPFVSHHLSQATTCHNKFNKYKCDTFYIYTTRYYFGLYREMAHQQLAASYSSIMEINSHFYLVTILTA